MFRHALLVTSAAAMVLVGPALAQPPDMTQPPAGQTQPPTGPPIAPQQSTMPGANGQQEPQMDSYLTDKDFVRTVAEASATQVHLGKIAQEKASSDAVKEFGKHMVEANTQTGQQLQQAAAALKVELPSGPPKKAKKDEDKLAKLSGTDFDHAYARMAADEQKQAVKEFEREAKNGKSPALQDYASKNLASVQEQEKQAEALNAGGTSAPRQ